MISNSVDILSPIDQTESEIKQKDQAIREIKCKNIRLQNIFHAAWFKDSIVAQSFSSVVIFIFAIAMSALITVLPQHDVIRYPEFWYEPIIPIVLSYTPIVSAITCVESYVVMNVDTILSWRAFLKHFAANASGFLVPYLLIYLIWTQYLGFRHPMPFIGGVSLVIAYVARGTSMWFLFPSDLRVDEKRFRRRLLAYLSLFPLNILMRMGYDIITSIFIMVPTNMQWCIGVFLPLMRLFYTWINTKIAYVAAGGKQYAVKHAMMCRVVNTHSFTLAHLLGSGVTSTTSYIVIFFDGLSHIWSCAKIIKLSKKKCFLAKATLNEELTCLTIKEFLKVLIPAIYGISFLIAYYGPNANILGNIQNDYWQYEKIHNIYEKLFRILTLFFIDATRGVILSLVLWLFCGINAYKRYCYVLDHYGILVFLYVTAWMIYVLLLLSYFSIYFQGFRFLQLDFCDLIFNEICLVFLIKNKPIYKSRIIA